MHSTFRSARAQYVPNCVASTAYTEPAIQDEAHLPNERISLTNLRRGKQVVERFLLNVGKSDLPRSPTDTELPTLPM